jgi:hypothetical protein
LARSKKFDKRGSGPFFWLAIGVLVFTLYSLTVAATTADDCGNGVDKEWIIFPPGWECQSRPGFG